MHPDRMGQLSCKETMLKSWKIVKYGSKVLTCFVVLLMKCNFCTIFQQNYFGSIYSLNLITQQFALPNE